MIPAADPTLDAHILERILLALDTLVLLLSASAARLEARLRPKDNVLADAGGVGLWPQGTTGFGAEFRPLSPLGDAGVDFFADHGLLDAARLLYFGAVVADDEGHDRFAAVFVFADLWGGKGGGEVFFFFFGPVAAGRGLADR